MWAAVVAVADYNWNIVLKMTTSTNDSFPFQEDVMTSYP